MVLGLLLSSLSSCAIIVCFLLIYEAVGEEML